MWGVGWFGGRGALLPPRPPYPPRKEVYRMVEAIEAIRRMAEEILDECAIALAIGKEKQADEDNGRTCIDGSTKNSEVGETQKV